jgi:hypothetical protein
MDNFKSFFIESVNKFNTEWQDARTDAKKIKDVEEKISFVKKFLNKNPTKANLGRVLNWARMTKLGYSSSPSKQSQFDDFIDYLENNEEKYSGEDKDVDLHDISPEKFVKIYKDLINRRNDFQHEGKRPKTMIEYLAKMKSVARDRDIKLPEDKRD